MLKKRLRLKTEELRLVNEILKAIAKASDTQKVLDKVLQIFYSLWGIEAGFIALKDSERGTLKVVASFGFLPSEVEKAVYTKGEGITGLTYKLGIPLYATEDEILNKTGILERLKGKKLLLFSAPIKGGEEILGVLTLFKDENTLNKPVERILETLSVIGSILGTFLQLRFNENLPIDLTIEQLKKLTLSGRLEGEYFFQTRSPRFKKFLSLLDRLKNSKVNLCFVGEKGVGKATTAKFLHLLSENGSKPLEEVDFRNFPDRLPEGDFLLLRHTNLAPLEFQREILKTIHGQKRVFTTSVEDLEKFTDEGRFLKALKEELCPITLKVPSLKERREDIPYLVLFFEEKYKNLLGLSSHISKEVVDFLTENPPEDNVKGLERIVKNLLVVFGNKERITLNDLETLEPHLFESERKELTLSENKKFTELLEEEEKRKILEALEKCNYVKSKAAKMLGFTLRQLDYRLKKYGIEVKRQK